MIRETAQLWLADAEQAPDLESALAQRLQGADLLHHHLGRNFEGSVGGGDYTLDLLWSGAADPDLLVGLGREDRLAYAPLASGSRQPVVEDGIWRTLLLRVLPGADEPRVLQFEREIAAMPDYMAGIRKWSLNRVTSESRWTHVWQQEYQQVDDLMGEYLMHPYHWGYVDRYFDPDSPDWLVDLHLAHCYCPLETSVLRDL